MGSFCFIVYFLQGAGGIRAGQQSGDRSCMARRVSELPMRWFHIIASQNKNISTFPKLAPKEPLDLLFVVCGTPWHGRLMPYCNLTVGSPGIFFSLHVEMLVSLYLLISKTKKRKRLKQFFGFFFLLLQLYLYQLLSRSHCGCQYCVCVCCDVCCAFLSLSDARSPFAFVMSVSVSHSSTPALESCWSVSFTWCWAPGAASTLLMISCLFSSLAL